MRLNSRAVPWWVVGILGLLVCAYVLATPVFHVRVGFLPLVLVAAVLFAVAGAVAGGPGHARLVRMVAPAEVFTVELDEGSRSHVHSSLTESWFFVVLQEDGLAFWTIARDPQLAAVVTWETLKHTGVELTGPVALEPVGDGGIYLTVKSRPIDLLRRPSPRASRLFELLAERLSPAQPDPAHTPPRAQTG